MTKERDPFRVIGWGPFRMPGEKRRMAALREKYDRAVSCIETASCEEGDHTYTWPCDLAPDTGSELREEYAEGKIDHGQCLSNLAGLVAEALMHCDGLDEDAAYLLSVTVANTLNARPDVLRQLINSIDQP